MWEACECRVVCAEELRACWCVESECGCERAGGESGGESAGLLVQDGAALWAGGFEERRVCAFGGNAHRACCVCGESWGRG